MKEEIRYTLEKMDEELLQLYAEAIKNLYGGYGLLKLFDTGEFAEIVKAYCDKACREARISNESRNRILNCLEYEQAETPALEVLKSCVWTAE